MNEQVTEIYKQMFAPEPIPDAVRVAFDRTNFLANRIDAPLMTPIQLAIIAGAATRTVKMPKKEPVTPASEGVLIDTSEPPVPVEKGLDLSVVKGVYRGDSPPEDGTDISEAPVPEPLPQETAVYPAEPIEPVVESTGGPTGIMDAPSKPSTKRRGLAATKMEKLTVKELKVHAEQVYGWKVPTGYLKANIIAVLKTREPTGT